MSRSVRNRRLAFVLIVLALGLSASLWAGNKKKDKHREAAAVAQMDERRRALHALNRLTFGPRPGDVDRVLAMGVDKWIDRQLHPDKIDDSALDARLEPFRTLRMDPQTLLRNFPPPLLIKAVANGKMALPSDPARRAIYESQLARYQARQDNKAAQGQGDNAETTGEQQVARRQARLQARAQEDNILALPTPDQRMQAILEMDPQQREILARALSPQERQQLMDSLTPQQREQVMAMARPALVVTTELMGGKLLRAAYSERQLQEVMTDFWFNHFNVFIGKGPDRYLIGEYEREVIRPRALGKFKDLLLATAKSPAMLFYLDNWQSVGPDSPVGRGEPLNPPPNRPRMARARPFCGPFGCRPRFPRYPQPRPQRPRQQQRRSQRGLNENYARELMELQTIGVDGGYTQKDVTQVARILTGWTIKAPRKRGDFEFNERMHEPGPKIVLGHVIKQNGEKEGVELLQMLARSPATARFISRKLALRFVSDSPPQVLVDRMADTFVKTDGDIREVLRTMFRSPEFWSADAYRAKVKTPLEFVTSAVRASGAEVGNPIPLVQALNQMGMPLYGAQPPTGYSMKAETWVNSAALLGRMNFALRFASGHMPGVQFQPELVLGEQASTDPEVALARLEDALLAGDVSKQTHDTIRSRLNDPQVTGRVLDDAPRPLNIGVIAGLILGSPEFQKR